MSLTLISFSISIFMRQVFNLVLCYVMLPYFLSKISKKHSQNPSINPFQSTKIEVQVHSTHTHYSQILRKEKYENDQPNC